MIEGDCIGSSDFYVDYNIEGSEVGDEFKREAEQRLRELAFDHSDMISAAIALVKQRTHGPMMYIGYESYSTSARKAL